MSAGATPSTTDANGRLADAGPITVELLVGRWVEVGPSLCRAQSEGCPVPRPPGGVLNFTVDGRFAESFGYHPTRGPVHAGTYAVERSAGDPSHQLMVTWRSDNGTQTRFRVTFLDAPPHDRMRMDLVSGSGVNPE